jgi:PPOX class probable F420-dependent enzyme
VVIYSPLDEKPKREADPLRLARARNLLARPAVTVLLDRWDEDWARLAWLRLDGAARILPPPGPDETTPEGDERARAIAGLRARYPQYRAQALEARPIVRIAVTRVVGWSAA